MEILIMVLKVLVFGIVEGFTEWLPISSTGHMILLDELIRLEVTPEFREVFLVVIQLGAILAVVVLYFQKLNPFMRADRIREKDEAHVIRIANRIALKIPVVLLWSRVVVACLPAAVLGLLFDDWIDVHLMNAYVVAAMLILYGILFLVVENRNYGVRASVTKVNHIDYRMAFLIGWAQVLALIPGTSRSGATILGAMLLGCARPAAAEFSFFLGIPVMFGASLLKLVKFGLHFSGGELFILLFGMLVAFLMSVYSIRFLMNYIHRNDFRLFGIYRIILGIVVLIFFAVKALLGV